MGRNSLFGIKGNLVVPGTFIGKMGAEDNLSVSSSELQLSLIRAFKESFRVAVHYFDHERSFSLSTIPYQIIRHRLISLLPNGSRPNFNFVHCGSKVSLLAKR